MNAEAIAVAKRILTDAGFVVLREKSYRQAQERQRIAECRVACEIEAAEVARSWARDCLTEERRLRDRLTFVYGVAQAHGATAEELSGDTEARVVETQIRVEAGPLLELSDRDKARLRDAMWEDHR